MDLEGVNRSKASQNISKILSNNYVRHDEVATRVQSTFGGQELIFDVRNPKIDGASLTRLSFVVNTDGNFIANASSKGHRNLVSLNRVGRVNNLKKLEQSTGIVERIIRFTVEEIKDNLGE